MAVTTPPSSMTTTELWWALADLAGVWRQTDVLDSFARELPDNALQRSHGLPGILQTLQAGGLAGNPLLLAGYLPAAVSVAPEIDEQQIRAMHGDWLEAAARAEAAHRVTIAWLRARLPGYPTLPAPQLAPGAPLTNSEFTYRIIWQPRERAAQLHLRDVPGEIAGALLADVATARELTQATRDVAGALGETPQWAALADAAGALDETARSALRSARSRTRERLAPGEVDAYEPRLTLRRNTYREHVISEELETLTGSARAFADAFDAADGLVEFAASNVFGQLACYPVRTMTATDLEIIPGATATVRYTTPDVMPDMPRPDAVAWLDDPLVPDAVQIKHVTMSFDAASQVTLNVTAAVLAGTAAAWRE